MEKTTYYRIFANLETPEITTGVFRHRDLGPGKGAYLERYEPVERVWVLDFAGLTGYLYNGEPGAEAIEPGALDREIGHLRL